MPESPNSTARIVSVRFEDLDLLEWVDQQAARENRTRSNMVVQMLKQQRVADDAKYRLKAEKEQR